MSFPLQPIDIDAFGVKRFRKNVIVEFLLDECSHSLNELPLKLNYEKYQEDWEQFAQLIGYSISGFCDLPYVKSETANAVSTLAANDGMDANLAKIKALEQQLETIKLTLKDLILESGFNAADLGL